jgi:hypothetical protein
VAVQLAAAAAATSLVARQILLIAARTAVWASLAVAIYHRRRWALIGFTVLIAIDLLDFLGAVMKLAEGVTPRLLLSVGVGALRIAALACLLTKDSRVWFRPTEAARPPRPEIFTAAVRAFLLEEPLPPPVYTERRPPRDDWPTVIPAQKHICLSRYSHH